ncbi:hypothetical protein MIND_01388400 [Mycena indigotica]|uniref:F-box domain-containing protein n=1 Tax=Mycena indigotica TaxID=2126181 RepID=A0A8H6RYZ6_9AGAR|nr:uncharacterized protein MIND_01388400 [Mycena indigotica]KAF7289268.1 hypothetical protein MIND_01388400 [Mycena indigotica]
MVLLSSLPHELLGQVFTECASVWPDAPLVLGSVSHLFRHVANTTPTVWTHLQLESASPVEKTALWFALSRACRLRVRLDLRGAKNLPVPRHGHETQSCDGVFAALRAHTGRISAMELRVDDQGQAGKVLSKIYSGASPSALGLRYLLVHAAKLKPTPQPLTLPVIPTIRDLDTTNIAIEALQALDLAQLKRLRIVQPLVSTPLSADHVVDLMRATPNLRHLWLEARVAEPTSVETQLIPQLEEVHIRANNLVPLLDRLVVPKLHNLYLDDMDGKRDGASEESAAVLHRLLVRMELGRGDVTDNALREFELVGVQVDQDTEMWQRCMQKMKVLESFTVNSATESDMEEEYIPPPVSIEPLKRPFAFGFGWTGMESK